MRRRCGGGHGCAYGEVQLESALDARSHPAASCRILALPLPSRKPTERVLASAVSMLTLVVSHGAQRAPRGVADSYRPGAISWISARRVRHVAGHAGLR